MEYRIESERLRRQPYVAIRTTVPIKEIGSVIGPLYAELFGWLAKTGLSPAGEPWARYLAVGPEECEFEASVPLAAETTAEGRVVAGVMPGCDVLKTLHVGPYDEIAGAYTALTREMSTTGAVCSGAMWESYLTDPATEPDPAKWRTLVCVPISGA